MQPGQFDHGGSGLVDTAAGQLVALCRRGEVFEQQHEITAVVIAFDVMAHRDPDVDRGCEIAVEADLALVVAHRYPCGPTEWIG